MSRDQTRRDLRPGQVNALRSRLALWRRRVRPTAQQRLGDRWQGYTMLSARSLYGNTEVARLAVQVSGVVVECGVWRGGASGAVAEVLGPGRAYFLFDSFEGLPPATDLDGAAAKAWQTDKESPEYYDNCAAEESWARQAMARAGAIDSTLVRGWFEDTLPGWVPPAPIALLRLDGDWYSSTKVCLDALVPQMAPGGIVIIDDYLAWDGCTRAVNEFLGNLATPIRLRESSHGVTWFRLPAAWPATDNSVTAGQ